MPYHSGVEFMELEPVMQEQFANCTEEQYVTFIRDMLPHDFAYASGLASTYIERLEYLDWADRIKLLDDFLWQRARDRLCNEEITQVINRLHHRYGGSFSLLEYATYSRTIITAILMKLGSGSKPASKEELIMHLASKNESQQKAACAWLKAGAKDELGQILNGLPGFAFLFLCIYPNDSAESFMARDAFWHAILGE